MNQKRYYLGKNGRSFGPYSQEELDLFKASGKWEEYTFIWDPELSRWNTIDPLPPIPTPFAGSEKPEWASINAICHNYRKIVSGQLENITDSGCDLISEDGDASPQFGLGSSIILNLIDPKEGSSMNVGASLTEIYRQGNTWVYHLVWPARPQL